MSGNATAHEKGPPLSWMACTIRQQLLEEEWRMPEVHTTKQAAMACVDKQLL
jgi:hypothetical protein